MTRRQYRVLLPALAIVAAGLAMSSASAQTRSDSAASDLSLELNIPALRLDVFRGRDRIRTYVVAVGLRRYPTPDGDFAIEEITWNPWWYPPKSPWARREKITRPGSANPMGKVKLLLGGSLYLHATPFTSSIGSAASHGCVRMRTDDAVALAKLAQRASGATITDASVDSLVASWSETRTIALPVPVPVRVVYELAEARGDSLFLHPDVYRLRQEDAEVEALRVLAQNARDTSRVDRAALRLLLQRAQSKHASSPIARLLPKDSFRPTRILEGRVRRQGIADGRVGEVRPSAITNADCGGSGSGASFN